MNMNTKLAIRSAAALSIGMLLATTACTDYAEEFKNDDNNKIYAEAEIVEDFETPFFSFDSANVVWQGYDNKEFNSATIADRAPFATSDGSSQVEYRGRDENGKNYTTNTLPSDLSNLIRRSGGIAGKLIKNESKDSYAQIVFPTGDIVDYSDDSKVSGLAVAMASEYGSTEICLLSISEDNKRIYKQYCTAITEKFGKDSTVYAAKVSIKELADAAGKNFGIFLPTANAIGIKISGSNEASFGFNIVGVGTYHDESTAISSASKEDDENNNDDNDDPEESSSSSEEIESSADQPASSDDKPESSSSVEEKFYWTGEKVSYVMWKNTKHSWILEGDYSNIWTVPAKYEDIDPATSLSNVVNNYCKGLCTEVAPMKKDTAILRLPIGSESVTDWKGVCVTYTNAGADVAIKLKGNSGAVTSAKLENTKANEYKVWDIAWKDFSGSTENAVKNLNAILFSISNDKSTDYNYINIFEVGQSGTCTGKTKQPEKPTFSKVGICKRSVFHWVPKYCDTCKVSYPDVGIHMCFDGEEYESKWEESHALDYSYGGYANLTENLEQIGQINTELHSDDNDYTLSFKLSDNGSYKDISHWEGLCIDYAWTPGDLAFRDSAIAQLVIHGDKGNFSKKLISYSQGTMVKCYKFDEFVDKNNESANVKYVNEIEINFAKIAYPKAFAVYSIGQYSTMSRYADTIQVNGMVSCRADKDTLLLGESVNWSFTTNEEYKTIMAQAVLRGALKTSWVEGFDYDTLCTSSKCTTDTVATMLLKVEIENEMEELVSCGRVIYYAKYNRCEIYEGQPTEYGSKALIGIHADNLYSYVHGSEAPTKKITWTEATPWGDDNFDEENSVNAVVSINSLNTITPYVDIEYYNGTQETLKCIDITPTTKNCAENDYTCFYWNGKDGESKVNTKYANNESARDAGYWYFTSDEIDGGKSQAFAHGADLNAAEEDYDNVISTCHGFCGTAYLVKGSLLYDPYLNINLKFANNIGEEETPVDVTSWGGICLTYSSDISASLYLYGTDDVNKEMGYDYPYAPLTKSSSPKTVQLPWNKFVQGGWSGTSKNGNDIADKLVKISYQLQAKNGTTANFYIYEIGSYGTCTGEVTKATDYTDGSIYDAVNKEVRDLRDGNVYKTVVIGTQTWMAENLNYNYDDESSFCSGGAISNCTKYGHLYQWKAAMDYKALFTKNGKGCSVATTCNASGIVRGVCPAGWHLPSKEEWETLIAYAGGAKDAPAKLKSTTDWIEDYAGTNLYNFSILPSGSCDSDKTSCNDPGKYTYFRTSTGSKTGAYVAMFYANTDATLSAIAERYADPIRCIKD